MSNLHPNDSAFDQCPRCGYVAVEPVCTKCGEPTRTEPAPRLADDGPVSWAAMAWDDAEVADPLMTSSILASCLTYAQRDAGPDAGNDAVAEALAARLAGEGWALTRAPSRRGNA